MPVSLGCVGIRAGHSRPLDGDSNSTAVADIGAYEYAHWHVDTDGDGMNDGPEVNADTDPTSVVSVVRITGIDPTGETVRVSWQGGNDATQIVERRQTWTSVVWDAVLVKDPPTKTEESWVDWDATNLYKVFYRIRIPR